MTEESVQPDALEDALVMLAKAVAEVRAQPIFKRVKASARMYRALKYLTDRAQEVRNETLCDYALGVAEEARRSHNEWMAEYPDACFTGDFLDEDDPDEYRTATKAFLDHADAPMSRLGNDHISLPLEEGKTILLESFTFEAEPFRIAERVRQQRVNRRVMQRQAAERRAAREQAKIARERALTEGIQ